MGLSKDVDVLVVGGGPAGLLAAETTASAGLSTLVLEREPEIGDPVRTSGGTSVETMRRFEIPERFYHVLKRLRFCSSREAAAFEFQDPVGCIIDVRGMYRHLAERASSKGASILTGANAESLIFEGGEIAGCNVKSDTSGRLDVRSKIVIDASGHRASLSKQAQLHGGFTRFGVGAEYDLSAPRCSQEEALLIVGSQYAPAGYAWVFPWGEDRVRVGVGILHSDSRANPKDYLADVMEDIHRFGIDLIGSKVREYHFGLIPSSGLASQFAGDRIMAVGDAAGQATLVAGEGIRLSMQAGLMAGQTAVQAISDGRWDRSALIPYEQAFRSKYARNLRISHIINERISTWKDNQWDEHIRVLKTIPPKTLAKLIQSEFAVSDILSWILLRPALWPRAARYICRFLLNRLGKSR